MNERDDIERRIAAADHEHAAAEVSASRLSWARLVYFVAAVVALLALEAGALWVAVAAVPFVVLIGMHRRASARADRARGALAAARGSRARMDRDWAQMPPSQSIPLEGMPNRNAIADLDLLGQRSLFRLLDVSQPGLGGVLTLRWLLDAPAPLPVIEARQASVAFLRSQPDFLLECARLCRHGSRPAPAGEKLSAFRHWADRSDDRFSPALVWTARVLTALFVILLVAIALRPALLQPLASAFMLLFVGQFAVAALARKYLHDRVRDSADLMAEVTGVVEVLRLVVAKETVPGRFGELQRALVESKSSEAFSRLSRLFAWNTAHHSPMLLAALNGLVAFDAHLASRIDDWRRAFGKRLPEWIDIVAEAQAIAALATLAHENPEWIMPRVHDDASAVFSARQCGHPLIANGIRVTNPVAIETPGSAIVVSGSNMSGKTTYLRAVGINAMLAFAGGPVCATELAVRRCRVRTTVRVEDDLGAGVSLFMAEVSRIAEIVADAGREAGAPVLFLLDEILHGTNAKDRREATQLVLRRLMSSGAAGIITTHDPAIADVQGSSVTQVHFSDAVEARDGSVVMTFDYTLKPGPATTTNALRILEKLGLR